MTKGCCGRSSFDFGFASAQEEGNWRRRSQEHGKRRTETPLFLSRAQPVSKELFAAANLPLASPSDAVISTNGSRIVRIGGQTKRARAMRPYEITVALVVYE